MYALFEMTEGKRRLEAILGTLPPDGKHWNEAQNRFHFVDRLLVECLGWEKPFIAVEVVDDAGCRSDYLLGSPARAVLEAKREAAYFDVPPIGRPTQVRKLRPLIEASKAFCEAVTQVIHYCSIRGIQIAVVCNGPQLSLFQAIIPGQSPIDGECYFFDGFHSYIDNFSLLWSILSPEGVSENRAYRHLASHRNPRIPPRASSTIPDPFQYRYRTPLQEYLRSLSSLLLEDIEDHPSIKPSFYRECYVSVDANNRHLLLSKNIIDSRYRRVADNSVTPMEIHTETFVRRDGSIDIDETLLAESISARPFVVLGDVGVGKTSFFENLYENIPHDNKSSIYFIHINLGNTATLAVDIRSHILTAVPEQLKQSYGIDIDDASFVDAIYHRQLSDFDRSIAGRLKELDPVAYQHQRITFLTERVSIRDQHLFASLGHITKGRGKQIVLIIDNADQRDFETQQQAFLIAQELAAARSLIVFVALRPSTFYQSKLTGALAGYQNRVLTIAPPPAQLVLEKRITFAVRVAEGKIAPDALRNIKLHLNNIVLFLEATLRSIRANGDIQTFLGNITGGNTRLVIELLTGFCGSPNVDSDKIVEIEHNTHQYRVPLHEFTKHALLGEYAYFNSLSSVVAMNVFDVSSPDPREHFLAPLIIAYISSAHGRKDRDGFASGGDILDEVRKLGFIDDQGRHALKRLAIHKLIETPHSHYREVPVADGQMPEQFHFRATSVGLYHLRFWMTTFGFLDATSTDTPIFDESVRDGVFQIAGSFAIGDRLKKADLFRTYLEEQWHRSALDTSYFDFSGLIGAQTGSFESVRRAIAAPRKGTSRSRYRGARN